MLRNVKVAYAEYASFDVPRRESFAALVSRELQGVAVEWIGCTESRALDCRRLVVMFRNARSDSEAKEAMKLSVTSSNVVKVETPPCGTQADAWVLKKQALVLRGGTGSNRELFGKVFTLHTQPYLEIDTFTEYDG